MKYYLSVLQNYANFEGRARRKEYWMFFLFNLIFSYSLTFLDLFVLKTGFINLFYSNIFSLISLRYFFNSLSILETSLMVSQAYITVE